MNILNTLKNMAIHTIMFLFFMGLALGGLNLITESMMCLYCIKHGLSVDAFSLICLFIMLLFGGAIGFIYLYNSPERNPFYDDIYREDGV